MSVFFDDLAQPFYRKLGAKHADPSEFCPGQIILAAVPYAFEQRQYWRPVNYDGQTKTQASQFNIIGGATDLYKRSLPLKVPPLQTNEEFLVTRSKLRPVVLIARPDSALTSIPLAKHHVVVPRFGVTKGDSDQPKYSSPLMERMRRLEFPEILFTPSEGGNLSKDGLLRPDLMQPLPLNHLKALPLALEDVPLEALRGQIMHLLLGRYEGAYRDWREMLMNP